MGILDNVKKSLGMGKPADDQYDEQYQDDDQYYYDDDSEYGEQDQFLESQDHDSGFETKRSGRSGYALDEHTPLISMTDVRSQELPPLDARPAPRTGSRPAARSAQSRDYASPVVQSTSFPVYEIADNTPDPLLQRHSLSNTGNFDSTAPAYYASRSGIGRVRGANGAPNLNRQQQDFRETVVIRPQNYAAAEQIAINLRQGNAVAVVLTDTRSELAKRILDFGFGAAAALGAQVDSPANKVYVFTLGYALTDQEVELLQARGVL
ncbi:hypothetical protein FACS1894104_0900 [Actinomycetota bacterium]|nr:hypothetical protein FACS1894104_0900 [Actinomycetota bacterium]